MDTESLQLALTNLASPPVLAFVLGLLAVAIGTDLRLPDPVYQAVSIYLLLAIGLKGGVALRESDIADAAAPIAATLALGVLTPLLAFVVLRFLTPLDAINRGAMAAHYGSTSLVTFTSAIVFLEAADVTYEGYVTTLLTLLEIPGIIVGLLLATRAISPRPPLGESIREVLTGRSILLLVGGLVIGYLSGPAGYARVEPFFGALFTGVLTLFLLELGILAGRRLGDAKQVGLGLVAFAVLFPMFAGALGVMSGLAVGMSIGGATLLGVLVASASYIAAPAAVRLALPEANPGITLTSSLGITFPFNLIFGIPLYYLMARTFATMF